MFWSFRWFRLFQLFRFGRFASLFRVLVHAGYLPSSNAILDKVFFFNALCFHLRCTDRDVWIASKRLGVFFLRARPSPSTAAVKRLKEKQWHLSALLVPEGTEISLGGKYIVSECNFSVSVAVQDLIILKLKQNNYLLLDNIKKSSISLRFRYYHFMRLFSPPMYRSGRLGCKQTARSLLSASPAITIHSGCEKIE